MLESWYAKVMPQIKDVAKILPQISEELKKIDGVRSVYVLGSVAQNINNPSFRVRDVDIAVKTAFNSEDLLSIDEQALLKPFNEDALAENGFDPATVKFSQEFLHFKNFNIDHWVISSKDELLHWGPIFETKDEFDQIIKDAEEYIKNATGLDRIKLNKKASSDDYQNWYDSYQKYIYYYFNQMPSGWYKSEETNLPNVLKDCLEI